MALLNLGSSAGSAGLASRADEQVEELVAGIAAVIRSAEPDKRAELKELAEALLRDEISSIAEKASPGAAQAQPYRLNPLAPGILIGLLGLGFLLIFPLVGLTLAGIGAVLMIWGCVMSWFKK